MSESDVEPVDVPVDALVVLDVLLEVVPDEVLDGVADAVVLLVVPLEELVDGCCVFCVVEEVELWLLLLLWVLFHFAEKFCNAVRISLIPPDRLLLRLGLLLMSVVREATDRLAAPALVS